MQRNVLSTKWPALLLAGIAGIATAQAQTVTFAGSQQTVVSGTIDSGLAADAAGNIYYASHNGLYDTIVKVSPDGSLSNLIGNVNSNRGIAVDRSGNVYVGNAGAGQIIRINSAGTQVVGSGFTTNLYGVAVDPAGNLWVTEIVNAQGRVVRQAPDASKTIFTGFLYPAGIAADQSGNIYVVDRSDRKVVKLSPDGSRTNLGGPYSWPEGVAVDASGNVFVSDSGAAKIFRIAPDGTQTTAMQGIAANNVAVDGSGNIIVADIAGNRIVALSQSSPLGTANVCRTGETTPAPCSQTVHLVYNVVAGGALGAANALTLGQSNKDFTLANNTCQGNLISGSSCSLDVTFTPQTPGLRRGAIQLTDGGGRPFTTTYVYGTGVNPLLVWKLGAPAQFASLPGTFDLTTDASSNLLAAASGAVAKITPGGAASTLATASFATGIAVDGAGNVLVADKSAGSVLKILPDGTRVSLGQNLDSPGAIAVHETGDIFVATATKLVKIADNGTQATLASVPSSVRKLIFGPDGILYLADSNQGVLKFNGGPLSVVSNRQASGLAIDASGTFYVTGAFTNDLYKLAADGTVQETMPLPFTPTAVAIDASGIVSVADSSGAIWRLGRSQGSITFQDTAVGRTSTDSPKLLAFDNIGNAVSTLAYAKPDPSNDFTTVPGSGSPVDCATGLSMAPGTSCVQLIAFKPSRTGLRGALTGIQGKYLDKLTSIVTIIEGTGVDPAQTITFTGLPETATFGAAGPYTLNATASSGLPVSYSVTGPASISGSTLTITGAGTVVVTASQAGDANHNPATPVARTIVVSAASQTITFTGLPATATFGAAGPYTLNATASSGLPVSYSVTGPASISGSTLTITGAGTVVATASQAGDANYSPATPVALTIVVSAASQTITFTGLPATATFGAAGPYTLNATASSGLPVSYTVTGPATISGSTLTITGAGTVVVTASQAGDANYGPATPVALTIVVSAASQTITFTGLPATATFGAAGPYTLNATASSGLPVSYTVTGPASISGSTLTITGAGTVVVTASQAGNASYSAATPVVRTIVVSLASQTITFGTIPAQNVGASVALSASATSGLPVSYTSSTTAVCSVSGSTATMTAAGTCTIRATQAGNSQYAAATPVTQSFTVTSAANFTIKPIPSVQNLVLGNVTAFALELKSVQNFNGNVTLSCSGGPAGSKCLNLPQTVRVNGTALAVSGILFPQGTAKGTYTMTFTGVSGSLRHTATAQFVVR